MARYKPYQYDQIVMVPISFQHQLEPGTLEYTLNELVEYQGGCALEVVRSDPQYW